MQDIVDMIDSLIIPSVQKESDIERAINSKSNVVFILTGNLLNMGNYIKVLKKANKHAFIHIDFVEGLSNSKSAIEYIAKAWNPAGIITTRVSLIKYAKELGLYTIQRIFLIDHSALTKGIETSKSSRPDAVEVLPGLMPSIIDQLSHEIDFPIIAGGFIDTKQEILDAVGAGALAISCGNSKLWTIDIK